MALTASLLRSIWADITGMDASAFCGVQDEDAKRVMELRSAAEKYPFVHHTDILLGGKVDCNALGMFIGELSDARHNHLLHTLKLIKVSRALSPSCRGTV